MSQLFVDNIKNRTGGAVGFPTGVVVTGVATFNNQVSIAGTLSYEDVTNVDSTGIITAKSGVVVSGGDLKVGSAFTVGQSGVVTATSFEGDGSALTGLSVGIGTAAAAVAGIVTTLDLSSAQDHKLTVSGISTITVKGGTEGDSHTVRIINSGITTVGFSTFFLFPSGADPSMPTADGAISLISFTVNRVGAGGTQLLAGAALNYS